MLSKKEVFTQLIFVGLDNATYPKSLGGRKNLARKDSSVQTQIISAMQWLSLQASFSSRLPFAKEFVKAEVSILCNVTSFMGGLLLQQKNPYIHVTSPSKATFFTYVTPTANVPHYFSAKVSITNVTHAFL